MDGHRGRLEPVAGAKKGRGPAGRRAGRWTGGGRTAALVFVLVGVLMAGPATGFGVAGSGLADTSVSRAAQPHPPPDAAPPDPAPPDPETPGAEQAPPPAAGVAAAGGGYRWPLVPAPEVLTPFRAPEHAFGPGHRGVDLAGAPGQPVVAARGGTVVYAGPVAGRGVVSVQHDDGLRTTYEPLSPTVAAGAVVHAGDVLGLLEPGHPGCPASACLHWGARRDRTDYVDPLALLRPPRVRLLPVPDPWPDGTPPSTAQGPGPGGGG